jgi:hypothetical protein
MTPAAATHSVQTKLFLFISSLGDGLFEIHPRLIEVPALGSLVVVRSALSSGNGRFWTQSGKP